MERGTRRGRLDSRLPVALAFVGGLVVHVVDQLLQFRSGPIPVLLVAPVVAVLAYRHVRPETPPRRFVLLLCWGVVGSGLAVLGVFVVATSYRLPRPLTGPETVLYDLGLFLWFVLSLTGTYAAVARRVDRHRYALAGVLAGPLVQFSWILLVVAVAEADRYV